LVMGASTPTVAQALKSGATLIPAASMPPVFKNSLRVDAAPPDTSLMSRLPDP
jgi:hypothetical protein